MSADAVGPALAGVLSRLAGSGELQGLVRLTGGATKATWSFDWVRGGERQSLILQQTAARAAPSRAGGKSAPKLTGGEDAQLMIAAREAGIPAPRVLHVLTPDDGLGEGYVTERVEGETLGKRIVGDAAFAEVRPRLAAQCGEILAAIHRMPADRVPFLARLTAAEELSTYAGLLAPYGFVHPALSYAIRWMGERLPPDDGLGEGYVTERVQGETLGKRIVGDAAFAEVRPRLAAQCGEILAAIHRMPADRVPFLARLTAAEELSTYAGLLAPYGFVHPALSYAIRWMGERLPPDDRATVVHADFRTGNLIVHPQGGIRCVLDWEIARIGDPMHDLGVLCMRSWRFGGPGECGGFGSREDLYAAYEKASGRSVDPGRVRFWEAFSNLKWAIACVRRGSSRGADGRPAGVELAAIGRRLEEPLWDFMALAGAGRS